MGRFPYHEEIAQAADQHGIRADLIAAIVQKESGFNTWAMRVEPGWRWFVVGGDMRPLVASPGLPMPPPGFRKPITAPSVSNNYTEWSHQRTSWGLMQVMGGVAREHRHIGWLSSLCDPERGLDVGCAHLGGYLSRYPEHEAIASYNVGPGNRMGDTGVEYCQSVMELERMLGQGGGEVHVLH